MAKHTNHSDAETSTQVAQRLETAVTSNDSDAYNSAMKEVQKFSRSHSPHDSQAMIGAITKKLEDDQCLPRLALYETKKNFDSIDSNRDGKLNSFEITNFKQVGTRNGLSRNMIADVEGKIDQIGHKEGVWGFRSSVISREDLDGRLSTSNKLAHLMEKGQDGMSLYDRLKDKDGNIPTIGKILDLDKKDPAILKLSDEDRETLKYLQSERKYSSMVPYTDDMKSDRLKDIFREQDLDFDKLRSPTGTGNKNQSADGSSSSEREQQPAEETRGGRRDATRQQPDQSASPAERETIDAARKKMDAQIKEALTVHEGESYWHSAERLLSLAENNDPTSMQLHRLSHQLWVADHKREANGLSVNQILRVSDQIRENRDVATLFQQ